MFWSFQFPIPCVVHFSVTLKWLYLCYVWRPGNDIFKCHSYDIMCVLYEGMHASFKWNLFSLMSSVVLHHVVFGRPILLFPSWTKWGLYCFLLGQTVKLFINKNINVLGCCLPYYGIPGWDVVYLDYNFIFKTQFLYLVLLKPFLCFLQSLKWKCFSLNQLVKSPIKYILVLCNL